MNFSGVNNTDIFSATASQTARLGSLANNALSRGIDLYMRKDYKGAVKEFQRAIGLAPNATNSADAASYMADAYTALDDSKGAIKSLKTALRLNPYRDDINIKLGNLYFSEEHYSEATAEYEKAVKLNPSAENIYALGQAYMNTERYSDADAQFNKVLRMTPREPNGNFGLGLNYSRQGRHEDAIGQFEQALRLDDKFYDAYAEMGYAYADLGQIDEAMDLVSTLENPAPELADTLSSYIYEVDPPKIIFAYATSSFNYWMPIKTPVSTLDTYLQAADASKTFTMKFQFDKEMERSEVENVMNWQIGRSSGIGPGTAYNFGLPVPQTEIQPPPIPVNVYYDAKEMTATVYFKIQQNATADGTIDPSHIEFRFAGKDAFGLKMNPDFDQFTGFSKVY
ncbi:MAG: tetratricopeptide repeat protein [Desulfobacterales bacterium]